MSRFREIEGVRFDDLNVFDVLVYGPDDDLGRVVKKTSGSAEVKWITGSRKGQKSTLSKDSFFLGFAELRWREPE